MKSRYLLWCANEHVEFRLPELKAIASTFNLLVDWIEKPSEDPFVIVSVQNDSDAQKLISRSMLVRSCYHLWGDGVTMSDVHKSIQAQPEDMIRSHLSKDKTFRISVKAFNKTYVQKDKLAKIESFGYLPIEAKVSLSKPDTSLHLIEYHGLAPTNIPRDPYRTFFGRWIGNGQREAIHRYTLKSRSFIGSTSMDAQLAFIMTNLAGIKPGMVVVDPFVGTGSILVSAAERGAYVWGWDIDFLTLHAMTRPTRARVEKRCVSESVASNLAQYGFLDKYLDVAIMDSSKPMWRSCGFIDVIITDPPYGIRESTERVYPNKIKLDHLNRGSQPSSKRNSKSRPDDNDLKIRDINCDNNSDFTGIHSSFSDDNSICGEICKSSTKMNLKEKDLNGIIDTNSKLSEICRNSMDINLKQMDTLEISSKYDENFTNSQLGLEDINLEWKTNDCISFYDDKNSTNNDLEKSNAQSHHFSTANLSNNSIQTGLQLESPLQINGETENRPNLIGKQSDDICRPTKKVNEYTTFIKDCVNSNIHLTTFNEGKTHTVLNTVAPLQINTETSKISMEHNCKESVNRDTHTNEFSEYISSINDELNNDNTINIANKPSKCKTSGKICDNGLIHYPSRAVYSLSSILCDLLNFSVENLTVGGRLVFWMPVDRESYEPSNIPSHPCLRLEHNCEQVLNTHSSRRLITMIKHREPQEGEMASAEGLGQLDEFRESFFKAALTLTKEDRKQRKKHFPRDKRGQGLGYRVGEGFVVKHGLPVKEEEED